MDLRDVTKKQHFIAQVEQRLNAINPSAAERNQKIYSFSLEDREACRITLDSETGFKISNTLQLNDLFSFEVLQDDAIRYNFEKLFYQYESRIRENTQSLLSKLETGSDIKSEILNIFLFKLLNFVRNPFSIRKVLSTFPELSKFHPTDPVHLENFERVVRGIKPHQEYLCSQIGVAQEDYKNWLSTLFLLLVEVENGQPNLLEQMVRNLYGNPNLFVNVTIYTFDEKSCLLSDRGYSTPLPDGEHMVWDFNLFSHGFIRYFFGSVDSLAPASTPKNLIERFKSQPKIISVNHIKNDLSELERYNNCVVYQCKKNVYSASLDCYGIP